MIPALEELKTLPQWVAHTSDKVPIGPQGRAASTTDPSTWMTYEDARRVQRAGGLAGVGLVMSKDDDLIGIDLDNAIESDGQVKDWAAAIICQVNSYTEVSPSGTGLHIWIRGQLPAGGSRRKVGDGLLEVYEKARYFTVTGRHLEGTPDDIARWGQGIAQWYWMHFEQTAPASDPLPFEVDEDLDGELAEAIHYIDSTDYEVWVAIGMAVKDHFGDAGFELWRQWSMKATNYCGDEKAWKKFQSFGRRAGVTYRTILHFAMEAGFAPSARYLDPEDIFPGIDAFCKLVLSSDEEVWEKPEEVEEEQPGEELAWAFDAASLTAREDTRKYLIDDHIAGPGDVIVMAGPPKSMKSFVTLDMLTHFACGETWHGIGPTDRKKLRSLVLNCELHIDAVAERLKVLGKKPDPGMLHITDRIRNGITKTMFDRMKAHVDEHGPFDILVIDPIANLFTEDNENDNKAMMTFLDHLTALRNRTMSPDAILWLVHHARKASRQDLEADPFNAFRGASSLRGYYDTGIAVWRKQDGTLGVDFELRNGAGQDRLHIEFNQGVFDTVVKDDGITRSDLDIIESLMCSGTFATKKSLIDACLKQEALVRSKDALQSESTWKRRINGCVQDGLIRETKGGLQWVD